MSTTCNAKKKGNIGRVDYILANVYLTYIVGYIILLAEKKLGMFPDNGALVRATVCMCISCLICILASGWHQEKRTSLLLNVVVSAEVFLVSLHMNDGRLLSWLPAILAIGVTTLTIICFSIFLKSDQSVRKQSIKHRFRQVFVIERFFAATLCPMVVLVVYLNLINTYKNAEVVTNVSNESVVAETMVEDSSLVSETEDVDYEPKPVYGDEYRLCKNIDRIKPIASAKEWDALTLEERQDTVRAVVECELRYVGIPFPVEIVFEDIGAGDQTITAGAYSHSLKRITINNYALMAYGNEENLNTALHEVRHIYQHCMCKIYKQLSEEERALISFWKVDKWCEDFESYEETRNQSFSAYQWMSVEMDARDYARKETEVYLSEIKKCLGELEESE